MKILPFVLVSCFFPTTLLGMTIAPGALQEALNQAVLVAKVRVEAQVFKEDPVHFARWEASSHVLQVYETQNDGGWFPEPGDNILVRGLGGAQNKVGVVLNGYPRAVVGNVYEAYLVRDGPAAFKITGFEAGWRQPLQHIRAFSRNRTDGSNGEGTGAFLIWRPQYLPIPFFVATTTFTNHPDFVRAIEESFKAWVNVQGTRVDFLSLGCTSSKENQNDGVNNIVLEEESWPFASSVIAITRNFFVSGSSPNAGQILDSDIILNGVDHQFSTTGEVGKHDVQNIVTHEVGHLLGLGHEITPKDTTASMFETAIAGETVKRTLKTNDVLGILDAYAGVSDKLGITGIQCAVNTTPAGCGAIHPQDGGPIERVWISALYLMFLVWMGRKLSATLTA